MGDSVFCVFLGLAIISCGICAYKREQVKGLIQKLASAKLYSKMEPINGIGSDDRVEIDNL